MADVYKFSYDEFSSYIDSIRTLAHRAHKETRNNDIQAPYEFESMEELDEHYHSTDAIEFFKNEMLS